MIKAAHLSLGLAALLVFPAAVPAQDNPAALAINEAVLRQANAKVLREKLVDARATAQRGDIAGAAKLYQESVTLAEQVGPGIPTETAQAVAGLASTAMVLARDAQSRGDLREADFRVKQVLTADPKNNAAIAFRTQNDQMLALSKGHTPSPAVLDMIPQVTAQKNQAGTLVQDGKLLYEMGKLDDSERKLSEALKLDPGNTGAIFYLNIIQQARYSIEASQHTVDTQTRMALVEKQWVLPKSSAQLPVPNPYATNNLTYTGPGRQAIITKLDRIHLDTVSYEGLPLNEVLRQLTEQSKLRDPERKGINFLINPNGDQSGQAIAAAAGGPGGPGGFGGFPGAPAAPAAPIDPATGLPVAAAGGGAGGAAETVDIGTQVSVKLSLTDVRLADVLDAIVMVAEHPPGHQLKYSILDFGIVFSDKGPETPQLFTRTFKVDPNTFYSGLESVGSSSFGGSSSSGGGGGGQSGGGGGGGGGGGNSQNSGAVVGVVNAFAGAGGFRSSGQGGGGGGGGGGGQGGAANPINSGTGAAAGGGGAGVSGGGGLNYITQVTLSQSVSAAARSFFTSLGVNLDQPAGKAVFFNDRLGILLVKATESDLDTIDKAIQVLNQVAPQVHIKARFIEVQQNDSKQFGFDWYLGQFALGDNVVGTGGSSPSLNVPASAANPLGAFPGSTLSSIVPSSISDQFVTSGLRNTGPAIGTITGILTDPNFRVVLHMIEQRGGFETLAEPEVVTTSGRQTQMRATQIVTIITGFNFQQGTSAAGNGNNNGTAGGGGN